MKSFLVILCSLACAYAAGVSDEKATVLKSISEQSPENFQYAFETDNGISADATGKVKTIGKDEVALEIVGNSQYYDPNGEKVSLTYVANEFGFQPQGSHLPTPPPPAEIPEYIARAIAYIAAHPQPEQFVAKKI